MALASESGLASYDQTNGEFLDLSDVLSAILLSDTAFLGRISMASEVTETTHYWMEDALNASTVTMSAADLTADGTTLTITADAGNGLRIGALLKDTTKGTSEVVQVTGISTVSLTVTRGYGSTDGEIHAASAVWRIISQPVHENHKTTSDRSKTRTQVYNRCQIFKNEVELSNTMLAVKQAGVANELTLQITNRTLELKRELGMTVYHGIRSGAGADGTYRSMAGAREFVYNFGGTAPNFVNTAEALSDEVLNSLYRKVWDAGAEARLCVGGADQITKFSDINSDKIRLAPSDRVRGVFVNKFLTTLGVELDLLVDRWFPTDEILICDESRIKLMPLSGRNWQMQPLAVTGDGKSAMLVGEFTLEVRNGTAAHAVHSNLTV